MTDTDLWWFLGGTGRYFRSTTIRHLASAARQGSSSHIIALILDPEDTELCESYANYRTSLRSASGEPWTAERVRREVLATILESLAVKDAFPQIRVDIGLRQTFSTFRYDMSAQYIIITKEDPQSPAMRCVAPGYYYTAYRGEILLAYNQSRKLGDSGGLLRLGVDKVETATKALIAAGLAASSLPNETVVERWNWFGLQRTLIARA